MLTLRIFDHIRRLKPGVGGKLHLTDAIQALLCEDHIFARLYRSTRFDCSSKLGSLKATVDSHCGTPRQKWNSRSIVEIAWTVGRRPRQYNAASSVAQVVDEHSFEQTKGRLEYGEMCHPIKGRLEDAGKN